MLDHDFAGAFAVGVEGRVGEFFFEAGYPALCSVDLALHGHEPRGDDVLLLIQSWPDPATGRSAATSLASFSRVQAAVGAVVVVVAEVVDEFPTFQLDDAGGEL